MTEKTITIVLSENGTSSGFGINLEGLKTIEALGMLELAKLELIESLNDKRNAKPLEKEMD